MAQKIPVPEELPQLAAQTTPDRPWPLRVLSMKIREYVAAMSRLWVEGEVITLQRRPGAKVQFFTLRDLEANVSITVAGPLLVMTQSDTLIKSGIQETNPNT